MPEKNTEHIVTESDNQGQMVTAEAAFKEVAEKLLADGNHWGAIAYGMSHVLIDWMFEHVAPEHFERESRSLIASQRYTARRYVKEIIEPRPREKAKIFFELLEDEGHDCIKA